MSLTVLMISALIDLAASNQAMLACRCPASERGKDHMSVSVGAMPSLKDREDFYRVPMHIGPVGRFRGLV